MQSACKDNDLSRLFLQRHQLELETRRRTLGEFHPDVAETLNSLGLHHHHVAINQREALRCHTEALHILRRAQQEGKHPVKEIDIAITLTDIGNVRKWRRDNEGALMAYREAIAVYYRLGLEADHPRVMSTHRHMERIDRTWKGQSLTTLKPSLIAQEASIQEAPRKLSHYLSSF